MLYELARNPSIQDAIYDDLSKQEMKPGQSPSLLRASLKEVLRLYPTAGATSRILASNSTFSGYFIPKGVSCTISSNFYFRVCSLTFL